MSVGRPSGAAAQPWRVVHQVHPHFGHFTHADDMYKRASLLLLIAFCSCYALSSNAHVGGNFAAEAAKVYVR